MRELIAIQDGLVHVPGVFFLEIRLTLVLALVAVAAIIDVRSHRIPNWLVLGGAATGLLYQAFSPYGAGIVPALQGLGLGFALFLPLYLLRAMAAGDVKLMAAVGSFLDWQAVLSAALLAFLAGGALALLLAMKHRALGRLFENIKFMLFGTLIQAVAGGRPSVEPPAQSVGKMPFGVAIALGVFAYVAMAQKGWFLIR